MADFDILTNRNYSAILRAMQATGQGAVASALGCSEATVSRMKDKRDDGKPGLVEQTARLLAALQLLARPQSDPSISPAKLAALNLLAREALDNAPSSGFGSLE